MTMLRFGILGVIAGSLAVQSSEQKRKSVSLSQWANIIGLTQNPNEELSDRFIKQNYTDYLNWCAENSFDPVFINFHYNE